MNALRPLALGHDQDASACHWAQLTRRTADYPSRRAQLALAVMDGAVVPTPAVVSLLYRCDDCGRCQAASILHEPPDLARTLWGVRARLVAAGVVPELNPLRMQLAQHGHIYGDLSAAWERLGPGDLGAGTVLVPDAAVLAHDPDAAGAALMVARCLEGAVALLPTVPDSGRMLRELGLAAEADHAEAAARQAIMDARVHRVLAGTPKEAAALAEVLQGAPVQVSYLGQALAAAVLAGEWCLGDYAGQAIRIVLHAPASLRAGQPGHSLVRQWLSQWLGERFCPEPDGPGSTWPAAVERPAIGLDPALARRLAQGRLDALLALEPNLILTCDPFSHRALRAAAPGTVDVADLLTFIAPYLREA